MRKKDIIPTETIKLHHNGIGALVQMEIWDSRLLNCCLLGENQGVTFANDRQYPVDVAKYANMYGMYWAEAFEVVKKSVERLFEAKLEITLPNNALHVTRLIHSFTYCEEKRLFFIQWNKNFIPLISGQMDAGKFMMLSTEMSTVKSNKRYCLYALLEKNLWRITVGGKNGKREAYFALTKEEIRNVLGLKDGEYVLFKALHTQVIKKTLQEMYDALGIRIQTKVVRDTVRFSLTQEK